MSDDTLSSTVTQNPFATYGKASIRAGLMRTKNMLSQGWTQHAFSRDANGHPPGSALHKGPAVAWCLDGALAKAATDLKMPTFVLREPVQRKIEAQFPSLGLWSFNDDSTSVDRILKLLDEVIADFKD